MPNRSVPCYVPQHAKWAVYQQDFDGGWYPLHAATYDTEAEAMQRIRTIIKGDEGQAQYFRVKCIVGEVSR